jgi:hypothetical protein
MQAIPVSSVPEGAEVFIDGELVGTTPISVELSTTGEHEVVIRYGSEVRSWTLTRQVGVDGTVGFVGDGVVLMGGLGTALLVGSAAAQFGTDAGQAATGVIVSVAIGATPLVIDLVANDYYELVPKEIVAEFE